MRARVLRAWLLRAWFGAGMLFLLAPIVVVVATSFSAGSVVAFPPPGWSLRWWAAAAGRTDFLVSLGLTLGLAVAVTVAGLALGVPAALAIVRGRFAGRRVLGVAALSPLFVPNVVIGFAALPIMAALGLLGSIWAVGAVYVVLVFPVIVRSLVGTLAGLDPGVEDAARVFGASPARAFASVTLPRVARGMMAAAVFSFVVVLDEAVVIAFIGGTGTVTFPQRLFASIAENHDPVASVFATGMVAATAVLMLVLDRVAGFDRLE